MATYAIGDVQGCYDELQDLLTLIQYKPGEDQLWLAGDLVNRGPKSLEVLRFANQTPNVISILGNHDLHLLARAHGLLPHNKSHTLDAILEAEDRDHLINWLRKRPFLHHDPHLNYTMVHAGVAPQWTLAQAKQHAFEVEKILGSDDYPELLAHLYDDHPTLWDDTLSGWSRLGLIIHCFTRMRFCDAEGGLDIYEKGTLDKTSSSLTPWFLMPSRKSKEVNIIFGHWAALLRKSDQVLSSDSLGPHLYALDGGCVWGGNLIAMRLEDRQFFSLHCKAFSWEPQVTSLLAGEG